MYLYRAFAADGALLYVGLAKNWAARWTAHAAKALWFPEVTRLELQRFASPDDAIDAERALIAAERPHHNVRGGGGGIMGVDRRGLRCPACGTSYARMREARWLRGTTIPFSGIVDIGTVCGDQSDGGDVPCPGILTYA